MIRLPPACRVAFARLLVLLPLALNANPVVTRLTPPGGLFSYGDPNPPIIARFLPGQRFDLQATIRPDPEQSITSVEFLVDDVPVAGEVRLMPATASWVPAGTVVATMRAISRTVPGVRLLTVRAIQSDGAVAVGRGNFEIVSLTTQAGVRPRNIILMIGDGMGIGHRTAARVVLHGITQGKSLGALAMDTFPATALVKTASFDSLITDSAAGGAAYTMGNKTGTGHLGVFPDDTRDRFDNPRVELLGEYLARTQGKWLGIVTTADLADATPAAFAAHVQERTAVTGIVDAYLDEAAALLNLRVLLGGGRRHFIPNTTFGSSRSAELDYVLPAGLAAGWGVPVGQIDPARDLLAEFRTMGFAFAATRSQLAEMPAGTRRLLGLFAQGNLNSAMDRIVGRRGRSQVIDDFAQPDQPMLDEMTGAALAVLQQNAAGFVLLVEGALIDKESHTMDTERWLHGTIEFDRAVARAKAFADAVPDTLVIVTADHETGGVNLIGGSRLSQADLAARATLGGGAPVLRDAVIDTSVVASPTYRILADGYPATTDVDRRMMIGYAANADRYEDWQTNALPVGGPAPYPNSPMQRDTAGGYLIVGQVPGSFAGHTGTDVPLSAAGRGASAFAGVMDNTEVFFKIMQAAVGGTASTATSANGAGTSVLNGGQRTASDRLINLSTRGLVGPGSGSLISGFILTGARSHRLLIRGIGPALAAHGISNPLRDPVLILRTEGGTQLAMNDDWESGQNAGELQAAAESVGAFPLPSGSNDAVLFLDLAPGSYTVELAGTGNSTGVALLEIYELP